MKAAPRSIDEEYRGANDPWLRAVLDNMVDGVVTIDAEGTVLTINAAAERIFGYGNGEAVGRNVSILAAEPYASVHDGYIRNYLQSGEARIIGLGREVEGKRKDGSVFPMELAVSSVMFGERTFFVGIIRDITKRKTAEEYLRRAHEKLASHAARLAEANEDLSDYAFAVSHDLKAPLRGIRNYSDFLKEDLTESLEAEQLSYLEGLTKASEEAQELVDDLLLYSQVGIKTHSFEPVALGPFILETVDGMLLPEDVIVDIAPEWPTVETSETLLRQMIRNLVSNAVKFNRSDVRRVEIDCRAVPVGMYEICVSDNGIGIDPQYFDRVFQIFHRLHTKTEYDGTGMGLAIVKKAASRLSGQVRVESQPGRGSRFFLSLPMERMERSHAG